MENVLQHTLRDPEDIDTLIEMADFVRRLISENRCDAISSVILYTMENGCYEAFDWCMGLLQEALEQEESPLRSFELSLGRSIPHYDDFIDRLAVDFQAYESGLEKISDVHGEVESFFNILVYKTCYPNIDLISCENYDTRDNDYIQYKLSFTQR